MTIKLASDEILAWTIVVREGHRGHRVINVRGYKKKLNNILMRTIVAGCMIYDGDSTVKFENTAKKIFTKPP